MVTVRAFDPLDSSQEPLLRAWVEVHQRIEEHTHGRGAAAWTFEELRGRAQSANLEVVHVAALVDEVVVAIGRAQMPLRDNPTLAMMLLGVHPDHRGHGHGDLMARELESVARAHGRSTLVNETSWTRDGEDVHGGFARRHGYAAAQTVVRSLLRLPVDRATLQAMVDEAGTGAGEGGGSGAGSGAGTGAGHGDDSRDDSGDGAYVMESAWDELPTSWLADRAELARRMSTDIPLGDLAFEEEDWDEERLRGEVAQIVRNGRRYLETVARHVETGRLVGYTALTVPSHTPDLAYQGDTLVVREHRGHRLGARMKAASTLALAHGLPEVTRVRTWNAQENEHMLAVNRDLGFEVEAYDREWQKKLG